MSTIFYSMVFILRTRVTLEFLQVIPFESMLFSFWIQKVHLESSKLVNNFTLCFMQLWLVFKLNVCNESWGVCIVCYSVCMGVYILSKNIKLYWIIVCTYFCIIMCACESQGLFCYWYIYLNQGKQL